MMYKHMRRHLDTGFNVFIDDLALDVPRVNGPVSFQGDRITQAFKFWLVHPDQDYGYSLSLVGGSARPFLIFRGWDRSSGAH